MKIATFRQAGDVRLGVVEGDLLVDVNRAYACLLRDRGEALARELADGILPSDVVRFLERGETARAAASEALDFLRDHGLDSDWSRVERFVVPVAQVELLPPVPRPGKIICVARNYRAHAEEAGREVLEIPLLFARFATTLVPPRKPIVRPKVSQELDWEGELAVVIGKRCRAVSRADAMDVVAGYSLFNDVTVRPYQFRVTQYTAGKNFDATGPFGPHLVLKDEVADPHDLELTTRINGEVVQQANTREMIFDIPAIIEHISEWITLEPGDVIPTGTPAGVGFTRKPPRFLVPGDVVQVAATGIGVLENPVVDEE